MPRPYGQNHFLTEEKKKIAAENVGLVHAQVLKAKNNGIIRQDEVSEALSEMLFAYCLAIERYDPTKGYKVSTYVTHSIKGGLSRYLELRNRFSSRYTLFSALEDENYEEDFESRVTDRERKKTVVWDDIFYLIEQVEINEVEEQIIYCIYNLKKNLKETGKVIGRTGESVRQYHENIILKIKEFVETEGYMLRDFLHHEV
tara:strand:- start:2526 stop:3128 length:603 start_codon:yes stop_codon:yes gene_type:complete